MYSTDSEDTFLSPAATTTTSTRNDEFTRETPQLTGAFHHMCPLHSNTNTNSFKTPHLSENQAPSDQPQSKSNNGISSIETSETMGGEGPLFSSAVEIGNGNHYQHDRTMLIHDDGGGGSEKRQQGMPILSKEPSFDIFEDVMEQYDEIDVGENDASGDQQHRPLPTHSQPPTTASTKVPFVQGNNKSMQSQQQFTKNIDRPCSPKPPHEHHSNRPNWMSFDSFSTSSDDNDNKNNTENGRDDHFAITSFPKSRSQSQSSTTTAAATTTTTTTTNNHHQKEPSTNSPGRPKCMSFDSFSTSDEGSGKNNSDSCHDDDIDGMDSFSEQRSKNQRLSKNSHTPFSLDVPRIASSDGSNWISYDSFSTNSDGNTTVITDDDDSREDNDFLNWISKGNWFSKRQSQSEVINEQFPHTSDGDDVNQIGSIGDDDALNEDSSISI